MLVGGLIKVLDVSPEKAETIEGSVAYKTDASNHILSLYHVSITDKMVNNSLGAHNIGTGTVVGADLHTKYKVNPSLHLLIN